MSKAGEAARRYLAAYAARDLAAVGPLLAEQVSLRDWKLHVVGKTAVLTETKKNFDAVRSLRIDVLATYERPFGVAMELRIEVEPLAGDAVTIFVVDVIEFDGDGRINAIRAYLGRGDEG